MKQAIKEILTSNKLSHRALCEQKILRQKLRLRKAEQGAKQVNANVFSINELEKNNSKNHTSCHIIGSGWSLADSMHLASKESAYVIGFNFACLSNIYFDAYFVEFGGPKCEDIAQKQKSALDAFEGNLKGPLLFKNLWEEKNDIEYASRLYQDKATFIRDIAIPCFHERFLEASAGLYLKPDWSYLRQYKSSALTAINYARFLGFEKIVLHGIDFGGGYFFDLPEFFHVKDLTPPQSNSLAYSKAKRKSQHPTAEQKTGINKMLPIVERQLRKEKVQLYTATLKSPSSEILPVFETVPENG